MLKFTPQNRRVLISQGQPLIITNPEIASKLGKVEAIFLQQLQYWLTAPDHIGTVTDGVKWIYNTYDGWVEELKIYSKSTIRRAVKNLEEAGIILSAQLHKFKANHTKWYTIDYEVLESLFPSLGFTSSSKKMNSTAVQNEHIITKITSSKNVLNNEIKHEEKKEGNHFSTQPPEIAQQAQKILQEEILDKLEAPLTLDPLLFLKIIPKLLKQYFGTLEEWRKYCIAIAHNAFLMGKKLMKSGDKWKLCIGWIFSSKNINAYLGKEKWFNVWEQKQSAEKETEMGRKLQPKQTTYLPIEQVINTAGSSNDRKVKENLYNLLGEATYKSWFYLTGFEAIGIKDGKPNYYIQSPFAKDWIEKQYGEQLKQAFKQA